MPCFCAKRSSFGRMVPKSRDRERIRNGCHVGYHGEEIPSQTALAQEQPGLGPGAAEVGAGRVPGKGLG